MAIDAVSSKSTGWPLAFWAGLIVLAVLWLGPLPARAQTAFSANMIIHLGVVAVAAPLLASGLGSLATSPLHHRVLWIWLAALLDMIIVLGWHIPMLHDAAARSWAVFATEQIMFLVAGLGMWCLAFREFDRGGGLVAAAAFFLTFTHMSVLGIVLILAPHLLYDPDVCRGAFGLSPLDDQRLGGVLMASWGSFTYLGGAMWLLWRALTRETTQF